MSKLTQPKGSVIHEIEIDTISKILGIDKSRIDVCSEGLLLSTLNVLIEPVSGKYFDCTEATGSLISFEVNGSVLNCTTSDGTFVLESVGLQSSTGASYIGTSTNLGGGGVFIPSRMF